MAKKDLLKKSRMLISSTASGPFYSKVCSECEEVLVVSENEKNCPHCYGELPAEGKIMPESVVASTSQRKPTLHCNECNRHLIVRGSKMDAETLANTLYCPVCGSSELVVAPSNAKIEDNEKLDPVENRISASDEESDEEPDEELDEEDEEAVKQVEDASEENMDDVEEEVEDKLEASDLASLEACFTQLPEPAWLFTSNGIPIIRITKSKVDASAHPIFAEKFADIFVKRAQETSLTSAVKEFNAEVFSSNKILNNLDLENMAFEKMSSTVMPKFIDCLGLAIQGAAKGIFDDLSTELKAAFFDSLVARGLSESDAEGAIEESFSSAGPDVFTAMVKKATELFHKPEVAYKEIKSTIAASGRVRSSSVTKDDEDRKTIRQKLVAGSIPLVTSEPVVGANIDLKASSVRSVMSRLSLSKKRKPM